jgi:hypothetical protein
MIDTHLVLTFCFLVFFVIFVAHFLGEAGVVTFIDHVYIPKATLIVFHST